jgi:hypothetical protein
LFPETTGISELKVHQVDETKLKKALEFILKLKSMIFPDKPTDKATFEIPVQIKSLYEISGDFSNVGNWKGKMMNKFNMTYFSEHYTKGKTEKQIFDLQSKIGYVMISVDSNHIIPITRQDEHQIGYEVLHDVYYKKYKVPQENYTSVYTIGNNSAYYPRPEQRTGYNDFIKAIQKFLDYGGYKNNLIYIVDSSFVSGKTCLMSAEEFVKYNGEYDNAIKSGNISYIGKQIIQKLTELSQMFSRWHLDETKNPARLQVLYDKSYSLRMWLFHVKRVTRKVEDLINDSYNQLRNSFKSDELLTPDKIKNIEYAIFSFGAIKNVLHKNLKENNPDLLPLFFNTQEAFEGFNRINL